MKLLPAFSPQDLATIAWCYARTMQVNAPLLQGICQASRERCEDFEP